MSAADLVREGQVAAEAEMEGWVEIRSTPTIGPLDPATGKHSETPGAVQYSGPFKLQSFQPYETKPEQGDHVAVIQRYRLDIPASAPKVFEGALCLVTASVVEPKNVGRRLRVAAPFGKTYATAQRLSVDEIVG